MNQPKLTKKERKAIAFRERKGKGKPVDDVHDVPEADIVAEEQEPAQAPKRKRADEDEIIPGNTAKKSKKAPVEDGDAKKSADRKKGRYILFIGNLSYKTTAEDVKAHFSSCPDLPSVRLLSPKTPPTPNAVAKSKGCAFVEFPTGNSLQHALTMHHSILDGRTINVELTSGGGGSSDKRRETLKSKNKALEAEREQIAASNPSAAPQTSMRSSKAAVRHSTTSGVEQPLTTEKTWSIPVGDEKAGRGGIKHAEKVRKRGAKTKKIEFKPSGANAVQVG